MDTKHIRISDYDYPLPDGRIAKFPLAERDHSKLLVYDHGSIGDDIFCNLPSHLPAGALMVFNNTKVIQARIHFRKDTGALIEVFLLEPAAPADYEQMFQATGCCSEGGPAQPQLHRQGAQRDPERGAWPRAPHQPPH